MKRKPVTILFVCLGNICRSPTAEAVFRQKVEEAGLTDRIEVDSAGILAVHQGEPADARMRKHARMRGMELDSLSRPVSPEDFQRFDLIIGMDHQNIRDLKQRAPDKAAAQKISLLLDQVPGMSAAEVPDPYYGGADGFEDVLDLVELAADRLLENIRNEI